MTTPEPLGRDLIEAFRARFQEDPAVGAVADGPELVRDIDLDDPMRVPPRPLCRFEMDGPLPDYALFYSERQRVGLHIILFGGSRGEIASIIERVIRWFDDPAFPLGQGSVLYGYVWNRHWRQAANGAAAYDAVHVAFTAEPSEKLAADPVEIEEDRDDDDDNDDPPSPPETLRERIVRWWTLLRLPE